MTMHYETTKNIQITPKDDLRPSPAIEWKLSPIKAQQLKNSLKAKGPGNALVGSNPEHWTHWGTSQQYKTTTSIHSTEQKPTD